MKKTSDVIQDNANGAMDMGRQAVSSALSTVTDTVRSGVAKTQDVLLEGLDVTQELLKDQQKRSAKKFKRAQKNFQDTRNSMQSSLEKRSRRRQRAKFVFRLGLLSGLVLVVLYSPWSGQEIRSRLVEVWNGFSPSEEG